MPIKRVTIFNSVLAVVILPILFVVPVLISEHVVYFSMLAAGLTGYWLLGGNLRTLIRPLRLEDVWTIVFSTLAAAIIGMILALSGTFALNVPLSENTPLPETLSGLSILTNLFVLFGEELIAIVFLTVCEHYLPKKKISLLWATLLSCLIFGGYHIAAYGWHVWQFTLLSCLVRIPFTYAWYKGDRNLLVNGLTHWCYNMLLFAFADDVLIYQ